ncbi:LDLR chaperone boca [Lepeophtheirus salmonis]|uniref:LDLR chaperone boca n=1 Tax=Lepeophtheirus salmonis TaxID=72036 RepID=D3PIM5_LEPSM|nr:LDLR chaperone boca-like [Lepeophtheirus salmonis]ADD38411.1 LDLR chaperone boca [Lepeophtheirus salmonis]
MMSMTPWKMSTLLLICVPFIILLNLCEAKKPEDKPDWAKKDIRDFSDSDMERLLEQWEEEDEPLPPDELPEGDPRRPQPKIDFSKVSQDPESILQASKKGKSLMMFVRVNGSPTKQETQDLMGLWQSSLWNNHIQVEVFPLESDRAIFMFKDGAVAWEAKDFLVKEPRVQEVTIEQKAYYGIHTPEYAQQKQKSEL